MFTKIPVRVKDFGFWTQEEISVQIRDIDGELLDCNHAGAEEEVVENELVSLTGQDIVWKDKVLLCKCGAYSFDGGEWQK